MFRSFARKFFPNRFDWLLERTAKKRGTKILFGWNRGLGDIALGLYAMVQRAREIVPGAEITFITRQNLADGFSLLEGVKTIVAPDWKRGTACRIDESLKKQYDLVIENPSPTDWVSWQHGKVVPRLKWDKKNDELYLKFQLSETDTYVGVQVTAETHHSLWRNWPFERWQELFDRLEKIGVKVLLFGYEDEPKFKNPNIIDLRGKTTLFELLSIIKKKVFALVLPDSGIASMTYYLDESFPIRLVSLWADTNQGILKQGVSSPNPQLVYSPLVGEKRDLSTVSTEAVMEEIVSLKKSGAILLAGGQGTRLGYQGPKGLFPIGGKTLFQWICDKVPKHLPLAIMTSPLNHEETVRYFKEHQFFGLEVYFFQQEMGQVLDEEKRPTDLQSPNGNGSVFRAFVKSGLAKQFADKGIDLVTVNYIDNPLTQPFDLKLLSTLRSQNADIAVQCIERTPTDLSMGVLVEKGDKIEIVEYTDLDAEKDYKYAYSGQLAFSLPFFAKMAEVQLPIHWVRKTVEGKPVWKGEEFLFDVFSYAKKVRPVCVPRETHYAPVKGTESIQMVQNTLRSKV